MLNSAPYYANTASDQLSTEAFLAQSTAITTSGWNWQFFQTYGLVFVDDAQDNRVFVETDVEGDVSWHDFADFNETVVNGNVFGDAKNKNGWNNDTTIQGSITGDIEFLDASYNTLKAGYFGGIATVDGRDNFFTFGSNSGEVYNQGGNSYRLGDGDGTFIDQSSQYDTTLVNGGHGYDQFIDEGDGDVVLSDFEYAILNTEGHVVFLNAPEFGFISLGGPVQADLDDYMQVFGEDDGGDAVVDFGGDGSIRIVNGASEFGLVDDENVDYDELIGEKDGPTDEEVLQEQINNLLDVIAELEGGNQPYVYNDTGAIEYDVEPVGVNETPVGDLIDFGVKG